MPIRNKSGSVTKEGAEALMALTPLVEEIVNYLLDLGMNPEEALGLITGIASSQMSTQTVRRRIINVPKIVDRGRQMKLHEAFKRYIKDLYEAEIE